MNNVNFMQRTCGSAARGQRGIWTERKMGLYKIIYKPNHSETS